MIRLGGALIRAGIILLMAVVGWLAFVFVFALMERVGVWTMLTLGLAVPLSIISAGYVLMVLGTWRR